MRRTAGGCALDLGAAKVFFAVAAAFFAAGGTNFFAGATNFFAAATGFAAAGFGADRAGPDRAGALGATFWATLATLAATLVLALAALAATPVLGLERLPTAKSMSTEVARDAATGAFSGTTGAKAAADLGSAKDWAQQALGGGRIGASRAEPEQEAVCREAPEAPGRPDRAPGAEELRHPGLQQCHMLDLHHRACAWAWASAREGDGEEKGPKHRRLRSAK